MVVRCGFADLSSIYPTPTSSHLAIWPLIFIWSQSVQLKTYCTVDISILRRAYMVADPVTMNAAHPLWWLLVKPTIMSCIPLVDIDGQWVWLFLIPHQVTLILLLIKSLTCLSPLRNSFVLLLHLQVCTTLAFWRSLAIGWVLFQLSVGEMPLDVSSFRLKPRCLLKLVL